MTRIMVMALLMFCIPNVNGQAEISVDPGIENNQDDEAFTQDIVSLRQESDALQDNLYSNVRYTLARWVVAIIVVCLVRSSLNKAGNLVLNKIDALRNSQSSQPLAVSMTLSMLTNVQARKDFNGLIEAYDSLIKHAAAVNIAWVLPFLYQLLINTFEKQKLQHEYNSIEQQIQEIEDEKL